MEFVVIMSHHKAGEPLPDIESDLLLFDGESYYIASEFCSTTIGRGIACDGGWNFFQSDDFYWAKLPGFGSQIRRQSE